MSASDYGRTTQPVGDEDEAMAPEDSRSLLLRLQTVRLIDDCELLPLAGSCWHQPEALLEDGAGCWD